MPVTAWYGHLKYGHTWPLWKAILVSWLIALFQMLSRWCRLDRFGFGEFTQLYQLKVIQECVTLVVFRDFRHPVSERKAGVELRGGVRLYRAGSFFAFAFKAGSPVA